MSVKLIIDSTADLKPGLREKLTIVPLTVQFGSESYLDGVTLDYTGFYEKLVESDVLPTTSQATPSAFAQEFQKAVDEGMEVVCLTISSKLSGTYQSAMIAAQDFPGKVFVLDTQTVAIGAGVLVEYALQLVEQGLDAKTIVDTLAPMRSRVQVIAVLDTLEYLKKGGRISGTAAWAGGLLSIKPVVCVRDGEVVLLGKARGSKQANNFLIREIEAAGGVDFSMPVLLGYTGLSDVMLAKYKEDSRDLWASKTDHLNQTCVGSVIGTHVGPGAAAVAFFRK